MSRKPYNPKVYSLEHWKKATKTPKDRRANRGKSWEREVEASLHLYQRTGKVDVWFRCHPELQITRSHPGGKIEGFVKGNGPPDFVIAVKGGPVLLVDAKDCQQDRFGLDNIKRHQCDRFRDWDTDPMRVAGLLLRFHGRRFLLPWRPLEALVDRWTMSKAKNGRAAPGTASLSLQQVQDLGLPFDESGWIGPLVGWWGR